MKQLLLTLAYSLIIHLWTIEMKNLKHFEPQNIFLNDKRSKIEKTIDFLSNKLKNKISFTKGKLTF